uniref:Uncharacterized protein n=1 Tax=Rhizophora mucronata TaxID=61149 RepID=A0A2P2N4Y7_RHIMU
MSQMAYQSDEGKTWNINNIRCQHPTFILSIFLYFLGNQTLSIF